MLVVLCGCGSTKEKEEGETVTVYLVTNALYDQYAPSQSTVILDNNPEDHHQDQAEIS